MPKQDTFHFSKEKLQDLRDQLKTYFSDELDVEIGDLQADLFIDFLSITIGKDFYNQGVADTVAALKEKSDDLLLLIKE